MRNKIALTIIALAVGTSAWSQNLTLDSCKAYALENNHRVKEGRLELEASEQVKKGAFTHYFPTINAGAAAMKANKHLIEAEVPEMNLPVYNGNPANIPVATEFAYFPGMDLQLLDYTNIGMVTAIQPIYVGGRVRNGNKLAALGEEFAEHQLSLTTEEVLVSTEYYYWNIMALEEKKKTLEGYELLLKSLLNDVTNAFDAGLIHKSDVLKVQLELNKLQSNKLQLENGLSLVKMTMAQHIGIAYSDTLNFEQEELKGQVPADVFKTPSDALINRNEYQMLNKAIRAEELQKNLSRGEYMPSLSVGIQGLYLDVVENQNTYGLAFATVSIPLSGWWGGSHEIKEHKIKIDIAQNNLDEKSELLMLQMEKSYKDLLENYQQIEVARLSEKQAEEHLNDVSNNYEAGVMGTSDLLEAQAIYQQSRDAIVDAQANYKIKLAYYYQVTAQN